MNILAIVVLYRCNIEDSKTISSLIESFSFSPEVFENFKLIIYDNGGIDQNVLTKLPFSSEYVRSPKNKGLAVAYNYALHQGLRDGSNWLLLLDQDSWLQIDFIKNLNIKINEVYDNPEVKAIVPKMYYDNHFFSPSKVKYGGIHRPIDMKHQGIYHNEIFAIGSGSLLKIDFFGSIGGFEEFFWLDCLDRWIYYKIHTLGGKVLVTNSVIEHELSIMEYSKFMNEKRFFNIILYESCFMRFYKSYGENLIYMVRLLKRSVSLFMKKDTRKYSTMIFNHFIFFLIHRKKLKDVALKMNINYQ